MTQHTDQRYEEELTTLRKHILEMGGLVERQIGDASNSLATGDRALAERTIERDHEVNRYDVEIDDECLRLLALHQPAAAVQPPPVLPSPPRLRLLHRRTQVQLRAMPGNRRGGKARAGKVQDVG